MPVVAAVRAGRALGAATVVTCARDRLLAAGAVPKGSCARWLRVLLLLVLGSNTLKIHSV
jgi:hypothetical protein